MFAKRRERDGEQRKRAIGDVTSRLASFITFAPLPPFLLFIPSPVATRKRVRETLLIFLLCSLVSYPFLIIVFLCAFYTPLFLALSFLT